MSIFFGQNTNNSVPARVGTWASGDTGGTTSTTIAPSTGGDDGSGGIDTVVGNVVVCAVRTASSTTTATVQDDASPPNVLTPWTAYQFAGPGSIQLFTGVITTAKSGAKFTATLSGVPSFRGIICGQFSGVAGTRDTGPDGAGGHSAATTTMLSSSFSTSEPAVIFFAGNVGALSETLSPGTIAGHAVASSGDPLSGFAVTPTQILALEYYISPSAQPGVTASLLLSPTNAALWAAAAIY